MRPDAVRFGSVPPVVRGGFPALAGAALRISVNTPGESDLGLMWRSVGPTFVLSSFRGIAREASSYRDESPHLYRKMLWFRYN